MNYLSKNILTKNTGNNAFAWEMRTERHKKSPTLIIPSIIDGTIEDIKIGTDIVFEEIENKELRSCYGLENFVKIEENIVVFDNHNHALYFWLEAVRKWIIHPGFELIHIDEHSDLWNNENILNLETAIADPGYAWDFTNLSCNVGNYILPTIECGLVGNMIRIENEYQIDAYMDYTPHENSVLNLDVDIFAPELDHIPVHKKMKIIQNLLTRVKYVTIATSPFFIEQWKAIQILKQILNKN
jgi:hypothetical protein